MLLRQYKCPIKHCKINRAFHNRKTLQRHLEDVHNKTYCEICAKGRLVFIAEQKTYPTNRLKTHITNGDPAEGDCTEILPHPWCNFCKKYYFNDSDILNHLQREHLVCHLCGDQYKQIFYGEYPGLETHFDQTHFLCPDSDCKSKCYVAFKTSEELAQHTMQFHQYNDQMDQRSFQNNNLLGFYSGQDEVTVKKEIKFKDSEGVDFSWFFTDSYKVKVDTRRQA